MAIDTDKLQEFLGRFVTDLGATFAAGRVVTGHHLGLSGRWPPPRPALPNSPRADQHQSPVHR